MFEIHHIYTEHISFKLTDWKTNMNYKVLFLVTLLRGHVTKSELSNCTKCRFIVRVGHLASR